MKKNIIKIGIIIGTLSPFITFAAGGKTLRDLVVLIVDYLKVGIYLILSLAVIMFIYNVFKYFILGSDDAGKKKEAGLYVMWSVIGFFLILSFWGLVNILKNTLNLDDRIPSSSLFGDFRSSGTSNRSTGTGIGGSNIPFDVNDPYHFNSP